MHQDLTAPAFLDADAELRRKVREERYGAKHVPGAGASNAAGVVSTLLPTDALLAQLLTAVNKARTDPISVANVLNQRSQHYQGKELHLPNSNEILQGASAVDDAIHALKSSSSKAPLAYNAGLARAASLAAAAAGAANAENADALAEAKKIGRSGKLGIVQLVQFGNASADEYLARLLVDDGDSERQGRSAILNADHHVVGFGSASHPTYGRVLVLLFTDAFNGH